MDGWMDNFPYLPVSGTDIEELKGLGTLLKLTVTRIILHAVCASVEFARNANLGNIAIFLKNGHFAFVDKARLLP